VNHLNPRKHQRDNRSHSNNKHHLPIIHIQPVSNVPFEYQMIYGVGPWYRDQHGDIAMEFLIANDEGTIVKV
jgi:hypothetical protein